MVVQQLSSSLPVTATQHDAYEFVNQLLTRLTQTQLNADQQLQTIDELSSVLTQNYTKFQLKDLHCQVLVQTPLLLFVIKTVFGLAYSG